MSGEQTEKKDKSQQNTDIKKDEEPQLKTVPVIIILTVLLFVSMGLFLGLRIAEKRGAEFSLTLATVSDATGNESEPTYTGMSDRLIDINTASAAELMTLEGIGEKRAEKIIEYREKYGPFTDITELKNISGIGENVYNNIAPYITATN